MSGPAGCYQKAVEEDDVTALKFGDLGQGEKFLGCLSMDEVRIIQESKINDDENDGVETTTTQTRTFQKTLEFTRRFSTVKTPGQTSMLRDLLMGEHAVQMHEYECAAFSNLQPQDAHEAKTLIPSLGAKAAESGADRFSEPELASMVDQSANIRKFD